MDEQSQRGAARPQRQAAALELRAAALAREVIPVLSEAGIRAIVLKGPAIRQWLYAPSEPRASADLDVLVAPNEFERTEGILRELGFVAETTGWSTEAHGLSRPDGGAVDLHRSLPMVGAEPETTWRLLSANTAPLRVAGVETECLSIPARALHLSLHAAQHPEQQRPQEDLERGLAILDIPTWRKAATVAQELRATAPFAAGLRRTERGSEVAAALGLPESGGSGSTLGLTGPAATLEGISRAGGLRERLRLAAWHAAPPPAYLRSWSPLARRGRAGLVLAYLMRPFVLIGRLVPAGRDYLKARRALGRGRK